MLSLEQVDNFLTDKLKFYDWKSFLRRDKVDFLSQLTRNHVINIYFHGVGIAGTEKSKRINPSLESVIKIGLEGSGGCCLHLNYFLHSLLNILGFNTFVSAATWSHSLLKGSHCVTIVVLSETEKYLIDVGSGIPNYEIVPLHQLPFRGIGGGIPFEFRYSEKDRLYQRYQLKGKYFKGDYEDGKTEELKYSFNLDPNYFEDFEQNMKTIFMDEEKSVFLKNLAMFRHFEEDGRMKFVIIWGTGVVEGDADKRQVTQFSSYKEMGPVVRKYFSGINESELTLALKHFENFETSAFPYA